MRHIFPIALASALVCGCHAGEDTAAAQQGVQRFHQMLDAAQFDAIYDATGPELKAITPKPQFVALLEGIHTRLGAVQHSKQVGWNVNYNNGGGTIALTYQTQFTSGTGTEQFVYRTGQPALLIGYHIESADMFGK